MSSEHYHQGSSNQQVFDPRGQANASRNREVSNSFVQATPDQNLMRRQWNHR